MPTRVRTCAYGVAAFRRMLPGSPSDSPSYDSCFVGLNPPCWNPIKYLIIADTVGRSEHELIYAMTSQLLGRQGKYPESTTTAKPHLRANASRCKLILEQTIAKQCLSHFIYRWAGISQFQSYINTSTSTSTHQHQHHWNNAS